jgi:anaerobic selenocysteine-containing dehydrogenase
MIVKTACARMDHGGCGLRIHVENGKIEKVEGDPEFPLNRGSLCPKGLAHSERLHHPDRLLHPLKRVGLRGENRWKRISWNEALDTIALRFREAIQTDGPGSIAFAQGTPKGIELYLMIRLANLLQVPTVVTPGPVCHMPRETAAWLTCGFFPVPDYDHPPSLVLAWGSNLLQTNEEGVIGSQLGRALAQGAALITIDPRKTLLAQRSKCWLRPRPGSDLALALAFLKVIVEENRYDRQFIEKWTIGFEELREHLRNWSLPDLSSATWVPREQIQSAARLYSEMKPACLQWGNALEHTPQSVQCGRAMVILEALTGNLDVPGGNVNRVPPPVQSLGEFVRSKNFPDKKERVLAPEFRLATQMGFTPSQILVKAIIVGQTPIDPQFIYSRNQPPFEFCRCAGNPPGPQGLGFFGRRRDLHDPDGSAGRSGSPCGHPYGIRRYWATTGFPMDSSSRAPKWCRRPESAGPMPKSSSNWVNEWALRDPFGQTCGPVWRIS